MILEPFIWDVLLIIAAAHLAIFSLVRMMRTYQQDLILNMRTTILERRASQREARARRKKALKELEGR